MAKRVLRSSAVLIKDAAVETVTAATAPLLEPPSTPRKRKAGPPAPNRSPSKSPKKPKYTFQQWEKDLAAKYPVPADLSLPAEYVSKHHPRFIKGLEHILRIDPLLYPLVVSSPFDAFGVEKVPCAALFEHHARLCRSVIGQQVSGAAARSIENKFKALYGGVSPTPEQVMDTKDELLRSAGLSARKAEYVKSISKKFVDGEVDLELFIHGRDEDVIDKLVEMKGIGEWSAKMYMAFGLQRLDVFAYDDLGVARGMSRYLESRPDLLKKAKQEVDMKLHTKKSKFDDKKQRDWKVIHDAHVNHIADAFKPYRTVMMLILWRISATDIDVLEHS